MPFVRLFDGQPSQYLWADDMGTMHHVDQGEGSEQGDALMPLLFSLGQHGALQAVQRQLAEGEWLFAFHDDVYVTTPSPDRVGPIHRILDTELYRHARIRINGEQNPSVEFGRHPPRFLRCLGEVGKTSGPRCQGLAGIRVTGSATRRHHVALPLGRAEFVHAQLNQNLADHETLLSRIPLLADVQSAWALLLHCAGARAQYMLRMVKPELVHDFAVCHNAGLWRCLARIIPTNVAADGTPKATASLPLAMGGMGLRDASRTNQPAFWASWADCRSMVHTQMWPR